MKNKKIGLLLLTPLLVGCSNDGIPSRVRIDGKQYNLASVEYLNPIEKPTSWSIRKVGIKSYFETKNTNYNSYVSYYGPALQANVYFDEEIYDEADKYYSDFSNYNYKLFYGSILIDDYQYSAFSQESISDITEFYNKFDALCKFVYEECGNTVKEDQNVEGTIDTDIMDPEVVRFQKVSKDGDFDCIHGTYVIFQGKMSIVLGYENDGDTTIYVNKIKNLPDDLSAYFITLCNANKKVK